MQRAKLQADGREIIDADWFTPDDLPGLPSPMSMAWRLIQDFLQPRWTGVAAALLGSRRLERYHPHLLERFAMIERSGHAADAAAFSASAVDRKSPLSGVVGALSERCTRSGGNGPTAGLIELYGESHRHYHTLNHIRHCLYRVRPGGSADGPIPMRWKWRCGSTMRFISPERPIMNGAAPSCSGNGPKGEPTPTFLQRVHDLVMATTHREPQHDRRAVSWWTLTYPALVCRGKSASGMDALIRAEFPAMTVMMSIIQGHLRFPTVFAEPADLFFH
jgi:hypothetical protein